MKINKNTLERKEVVTGEVVLTFTGDELAMIVHDMGLSGAGGKEAYELYRALAKLAERAGYDTTVDEED